MATAAENKEIVRAAYEGMANGDPKAFLGAMDPEIEVHEPEALPYGGSYKGIGEVVGFMKQAAAVVDGRMEVKELTAEDDRVVAVLTLGLKGGDEALVSEHWVLRDGKGVELRVFWLDPAKASAAA